MGAARIRIEIPMRNYDMNAWMARMLAASALALAGDALAHGEGDRAPAKQRAISGEEHPWGRQGDPRKATRTIIVDMSDAMRYSPSEVKVKRGETVKFIVRNIGKAMHEMVLGTEEELRKHAELMRKHPGMEHAAPYMAHVAPGKKETIAWTFDRPGTFMYGCLVPGHWEAGMRGSIVVAN
jgi:uncharacterized cupredoxin-like copper-binding protein